MSVAVTVELFLGGAWVNITTDVRCVSDVITINHGAKSESATADPARCDMSWNNRGGKYSPRNPTGIYYGLLTKNTPCRVKVGTAIRFSGEVVEFPSRWNLHGSDVWVPVTASGWLRRLAHGGPVQSTLTRTIRGIQATYGGINGYWPMEDPEGSTEFASAIPGGTAAVFSGSPVLSAIDPGDDSEAIPIVSGSVIVATAIPVNDDEFTLGFYLSLPTGGTTNGAELVRVECDADIALWTINYATGGGLTLNAYRQVPGGLFNVLSLPTAFAIDGETHFVKLEVETDVGPTVNYAISVFGRYTISGSFAGFAKTITRATINAANNITGDVAIGQLVLGTTNTALVGVNFDAGLLSYNGETIKGRLDRVAAAAGIPMAVAVGSNLDVELGKETAGTVLGIMREAEAADAGGLLYDTVDSLGLSYASRTSRQSDVNTSAVTLNYASGHLSAPLEPTDDDQNLNNDVTVTRIAGVTARQYKATGPLSVLPYPNGVGPYEAAASLALYSDTQPVHVAGWLLSVGTTDELRYPQLTVDMVKNPAIVTALETLRPGKALTVSNLPAWLPPGPVELHVLGWTERISQIERVLTMNLAPAAPYRVYQIETQTFGRLDSDTTVTNEPLDTTETGVDFTGDTWVTTATRPGDFPFDIVIGGEVMRVTAATASSFTVTRSINGVVKSHLTAAPIRLAYPVHLAL